MKFIVKCAFVFYCLLTSITVLAQEEDTTVVEYDGRTFTQVMDSLYSGLIVNRIPYNALYNRVYGWANLLDRRTDDTANSSLIKQSWNDLQNSSYNIEYNKYLAMRSAADSLSNIHILPLITINYNYSVFDTTAAADGRLRMISGILTDNGQGLPPYIVRNTTMAGFLIDSLTKNTPITLAFLHDNLSLENSQSTINSVIISDSIEGWQYNLNNGDLQVVSFTQPGIHNLTVTLVLSNLSLAVTHVRINIINARTSGTGPCDPEDHIVSSNIAYQGLGETDATTSKADWHVYYHHDATGSCEKKLLKPIIILDGYDPQDERSFEYIYDKYLSYEDQYHTTVSAGEELRANTADYGYDVIVLNFPILNNTDHPDRAQVPDDIQKKTGPNTFVTIHRKGRDGGTDYIERNAFLLVKLIQEVNAQLAANGSNEKIVIIGPSMGGQISRYALAYMEKQHSLSVSNMDHNCRLWVSFDSPHWGANIPLSLQESIHFMGYGAQNTGAADSYEQNMNTPAGQQLLIEQVAAPNNGNLLRQNYINSIAGVGLANSGGYPMNLRKIALVNGSGAGLKVHTELQQNLGIGAYTLSALNFHVFTLNNYFLPAPNNSGTIAFTWVKSPVWYSYSFPFYGPKFITYQRQTTLYNGNQRGCMDVVPGGKYDAHGNSIQGLFDALDKAWVHNKQVYTYVPYHTFIPTISALGFKNPDVNWYQRVNDRNLICTNEIPFDNYFVGDTNEEHVTLTLGNVPWLKKELINNRLNPNCQQICPGTITSTLCEGNSYTLSLSNPSGMTITWDVVRAPLYGNTSNLTVNNSSNTIGNTYVNFSATTYYAPNTENILIGHVTNACGGDYDIVKKFTIVNNATLSNPNVGVTPVSGNRYTVSLTIPAAPPGVSYDWTIAIGTNSWSGTGTTATTTRSNTISVGNNFSYTVTYNSYCGSVYKNYDYELTSGGGYGAATNLHRIARQNTDEDVKVLPNPADKEWQFIFSNKTHNANRIVLYDLAGKTLFSVDVLGSDLVNIPCEGLPKGAYLAKIEYADRQTQQIKLQRE